MPKVYKIILVLILAFLAIGVGFLLYSNLSKEPLSPVSSKQQSDLPDYILPSDEEARVREFVKNFGNLYNTYSYADYSNMTALGDYQTPQLQAETLSLVNSLENSVKFGFAKETKVDIASFSYKYPSAGILQVSVVAEVFESQNFYPKSETAPAWQKYLARITLDLVKNNQNWLVSQIQIVKK